MKLWKPQHLIFLIKNKSSIKKINKSPKIATIFVGGAVIGLAIPTYLYFKFAKSVSDTLNKRL